MIKWSHGSQPPEISSVAVIAVDHADKALDRDEAIMLLDGLYRYTPDGWVTEWESTPLPWVEFWYCTETDLIGHLRAAVALRANGHG